jgi:hypothetical protein
MSTTPEEALLIACRHEEDWLSAKLAEFETGARRVVGRVRDRDIDLTTGYVIEFHHKLVNLRTILRAYERLRSK